MTTHAQQLAHRRKALIARCQHQRAIMSMQAEQLAKSLSVVNLGLATVAKVKNNPLLVSAVVVGLLVLKPRRVMSWLQAGLVALQAWRSLEPAWRHLMARRRSD